MKYELLSITPNMDVDTECFILRVKKIPNPIETRLGYRKEVTPFIRKEVAKQISEDVNLIRWK